MRIKILIISVLISLFVFSCTDTYVYNASQRKLINNSWKVNTYVDYSQNSTLEIIQAVYVFEESGVLTKIYPNNDTVTAEWEMSVDAQYLTLGSNVFKITELTNKVMSLRFGDTEMFFIAID
ncbi:MAG: hypothetical protein PHP52_01730 [Bacteroidales bacterium]|nr:hypothetical protein [Bacteroidales bacterium]MDD4216648.1 hypothetical protein [Bacteroidales bacterium]MDY0141765.1 hypothetical protein [Bacteroidales bacterium]